jgi:tetratricopeptide (TPR) repeat protein
MPNLEEKIAQGQEALDQNNIDLAHQLFTEVVTENSEKWMAWRGLGFTNIQKDNPAEAVAAFSKATLIRPDDVEAQYGSGIAFQKAGDHAKAIKALEEALRHDHKHLPSKTAISESLLAQVQRMKEIGNLLAVEEYLEKAHKFSPEDESITIQLFRYYEKTGQGTKLETAKVELNRREIPIPDRELYQPEEEDADKELPTSLPELRSLVAEQSNNWQAHRAIGFLELEANNPQAAHDAFKKATVIRPDDAEAQYGYGQSLQDLEDHSHAIHAFEEALNRDKHHAKAKTALNKSLLAYVDRMEDIGNLFAVEQYLERAHKNDSTDEHVTARLLGYYTESGQGHKKQAVIKDLEAHGLAIPEEIKPHKSTTSNTGNTTAVSADNIEGIENLTAHLATQGEDWQNWRKLGFAYLEADQPQKAAEVFKKATVIRFEDAESQYGFGLAHQKQGDHSHAIHPFEEAIRQDPNHQEAKQALKISLLAYCDHMRGIGNLLAIEQFLEKAHKLDPTDEATTRLLFEYYKETGQGTQAAKIAIELGFDAPEMSAGAGEVPLSQQADLLLPAEKGYQPETSKAEPTINDPNKSIVGNVKAYSEVPEMLPCPACKQMMLGRSRLCPHCGKTVDPIIGTVISGRNAPEESGGFFKKLFGKGK